MKVCCSTTEAQAHFKTAVWFTWLTLLLILPTIINPGLSFLAAMYNCSTGEFIYRPVLLQTPQHSEYYPFAQSPAVSALSQNTIFSNKVQWSPHFLVPSSNYMEPTPCFYPSRIVCQCQFFQIFLESLSFPKCLLQSHCPEVPVCQDVCVYVCMCVCVCVSVCVCVCVCIGHVGVGVCLHTRAWVCLLFALWTFDIYNNMFTC